MMRHRSRLLFWPLLAAVLVSGCTKPSNPFRDRPVSTIYNEAMDELRDAEFDRAALLFDEVERQHPYSVWATRAMLMNAYAHYRSYDYEDAIIATERFIRLYPGNSHVAYAYYLRALCHYEQMDTLDRDQTTTRLARDTLQEVITRFPESEYASDAQLKLDLVLDQLAGHEMMVGRYYQDQGHHLAALKRFQNVLADYQTTAYTPEALYRTVEIYATLGLVEEAQRSAAVLGHNYPGSDWYGQAFWIIEAAQEPPERPVRSFVDRLF